jgi:hypothetical protein
MHLLHDKAVLHLTVEAQTHTPRNLAEAAVVVVADDLADMGLNPLMVMIEVHMAAIEIVNLHSHPILHGRVAIIRKGPLVRAEGMVEGLIPSLDKGKHKDREWDCLLGPGLVGFNQ